MTQQELKAKLEPLIEEAQHDLDPHEIQAVFDEVMESFFE
jgi:hypothetical protein